MRTASASNWIAAATALSEDPTAQVVCPQCDHRFLEVRDVPFSTQPARIDRILFCENCGARNVVTMLAPASQGAGEQ
jgi:hypothetical protein